MGYLLRFDWEVTLRLELGEKLFCGCPVEARLGEGPVGEVWRQWERRFDVFQPSLGGWQSAISAAGVEQEALFYAFRRGEVCEVELGERRPGPINEKALRRACGLALGLGATLPSSSQVMRFARPRLLYPSGFVRGLWIGAGGQVMGRGENLLLELLWLQEEGCRLTSSRGRMAAVRADIASYGCPQLVCQSAWFEAETDALVTFGGRLREAGMTTGWLHSGREQFRLYVKDGEGRVTQLWGIPSEVYLGEALGQLRLAHQERIVRRRDVSEVFRYIRGADRAERWGWLAPRAHAPEPSLMPVALPAPASLSVAPVRWGWCEAWRQLGLSEDVIRGLLEGGRAALFEQLVRLNPNARFTTWGELLVRWPRSFQREGLALDGLSEARLLALGSLYGMGRCEREILRALARDALLMPTCSVQTLLDRRVGRRRLTEAKLRQELPKLLAALPLPRATNWAARERYWMGALMTHLRGLCPGALVRQELYRYFSTTPPSPLDRCTFPPPGARKAKMRGGLR